MHGLDLEAANNMLTVFQIVLAIHLTSFLTDFLVCVFVFNEKIIRSSTWMLV